MSGLIAEIQQSALDPSVRVTDLLRKVKLAAVKLELTDAIDWVDRELTGYVGVDEGNLPSYRRGHGTLMKRDRFGQRPATGDTMSVAALSQVFLREPLSSVEALASGEGTTCSIGLDAHLETMVKEAMGLTNCAFNIVFSKSMLVSVIDRVRDLVLDWAVSLERQGVSGEGISFSMNEKHRASGASITIQGNVANLHSGDITGHQNRVVINSVDASQNTMDFQTLFQSLTSTINQQVASEADRTALLKAVVDLQATRGSQGYVGAYQRFVELAANHVTILGPFLPALSQWLS
ncbi:AbiTii domain-containing protein [Blastomonas sp. SL216]|uniref:AbiTii domain-containing protein n=1 Tax=Blastomonas sp. SL216 TaxID=2995169 RepID=UPI0023774A76|nr:hypothetical protein OU999_08450 [Blastomonas sp. SL216]